MQVLILKKKKNESEKINKRRKLSNNEIHENVFYCYRKVISYIELRPRKYPETQTRLYSNLVLRAKKHFFVDPQGKIQ